MATYKVLQDIEGEDHLIAWLTPKQAVYAAIVAISCGLAFVMGKANMLLAVPWLIPIGFFGFLAAPLGKDQPNDVWAAAQLRFYFKSRKRIWDQSGMEELVHITVPKRIEKIYSDGLSQTEVRSRLRALSTTIDSRGWAIKNSTVNESVAPQFTRQFTQASDDRLVGSESLTQDVPIADVTAADDILDATSNSVAQHFDEAIKKQAETRKQHLIQTLHATNTPTSQAAKSSMPPQSASTNSTNTLSTFEAQVVAPGASLAQSSPITDTIDPSAQALLDKLHHEQEIAKEIAEHSHQKTLKTPEQIAEAQRLAATQAAEAKRLSDLAEQKRLEEQAANNAPKTAPDAILKELSQSDLKISTLASQAKRSTDLNNQNEEVVISLH